jgi:hypothetical protein
MPRPPSRQSKPSTRTAGGWKPNRARAHPAPPRGDMDGAADGRGVGQARAATGAGTGGQSVPNRLSRTTGFDARRGGDPQNSGAAERPLSSPCQQQHRNRQHPAAARRNMRRQKDPTFERRRSSRSMPAPASIKPPPLWWHRRGATGRRGLGQKSGLLASPAAATGRGLFTAAKWFMAFFGFG